MTPKAHLKYILTIFLILGTILATGLPATANPGQQEQMPDRFNALPTAAYSATECRVSDYEVLQPQITLEPWSSIVYQTFRHHN